MPNNVESDTQSGAPVPSSRQLAVVGASAAGPLPTDLAQNGGDGVKMAGMARFAPAEELFVGRRFDAEIVVLCAPWYLSFKLSYRDRERGITMAHTTILRWVQHYTPEFQKRWNRFARPMGGSWRMDETYIRVKASGCICIGR